MPEEVHRSRLGQGLAALMGDVGEGESARARGPRRVAIEFVRPNPRIPRRHYAEAELAELSNSIKEKGILQPILVRGVAGAVDAYEIIAGERRWRAAQRARLPHVPLPLLEGG